MGLYKVKMAMYNKYAAVVPPHIMNPIQTHEEGPSFLPPATFAPEVKLSTEEQAIAAREQTKKRGYKTEARKESLSITEKAVLKAEHETALMKEKEIAPLREGLAEFLKEQETGEECEYDATLFDRVWRLEGQDRWYVRQDGVASEAVWTICPNRASIGVYVERAGLNDAEVANDFFYQVDRRLVQAEVSHPFYPTGVVEIYGQTIFNANKIVGIEPVATESFKPETIKHELSWLLALCDNNTEQYNRLLDVMSILVGKMLNKKGSGLNLPSVFLLGQVDAGKSLLTELLRVLLGGKASNGASWIYGRSQFSGKILACPLMLADDAEFQAQKGSGAYAQGQIKSVAASPTQEWRAMFCEGLTLPWGGGLFVIGNLNKLRPIFTVSSDFKDKVIMIQCGPGYATYKAHFEAKRKEFGGHEAYFASIAHQFVRFLLDRPISCEGRFGVKDYIHPNIQRSLGVSNEDSDALELIDSYFNRQERYVKEMKNVSVSAILNSFDLKARQTNGMSSKSVRAMLDSLSDNGNDRCQIQPNTGNNHYYILKRNPDQAGPTPQNSPEPDPMENVPEFYRPSVAYNEAITKGADELNRERAEEFLRKETAKMNALDRKGPSARFQKNGGAN